MKDICSYILKVALTFLFTNVLGKIENPEAFFPHFFLFHCIIIIIIIFIYLFITLKKCVPRNVYFVKKKENDK